MPLISVLSLLNLDLFPSLFHIDMSHGLITIEDISDLLESRAFSLRKDEVNPNRFKYIPTL